jgi:hypothetical protein
LAGAGFTEGLIDYAPVDFGGSGATGEREARN